MNLPLLTQLQKRLFAWGMSKANTADQHGIQLINCHDHETLADLKAALLSDLQGEVLEIGPGAGANFAYYSPHIHWVGVEPNTFMHSYLRQAAQQHDLQHIKLHTGTAEQLPVPSASIDTVVSTHVLCSVGQLDNVLQEVQRVLKPGGTFIFLEHVAATSGSRSRQVQNAVTPVWNTLFDQCYPNRETWKALEAAGFESVQYEHFQIPLPIVGPHIAGVATKRAIAQPYERVPTVIN